MSDKPYYDSMVDRLLKGLEILLTTYDIESAIIDVTVRLAESPSEADKKLLRSLGWGGDRERIWFYLD